MAEPVFEWLGNELCLDFHNTACWSEGAPVSEQLESFDDLVAWCEASGTVDASLVGELTAVLDEDGREAALTQAYDLRSVIHDIFAALARSETPEQAHLEELNDFLASVLVRVEWPAGEDPVMASGAVGVLCGLLAPVVWSAASLLISPFRDKLGECSNGQCGRLYVDMSRRGNRRWCDMTTCGNRAKASRHYDRHRTNSPE